MDDIIIIGAGLAGLTLAHHSKLNNRSTSVIEARNRTGGRIYNQDTLSGNVDLGAEYIGNYHSSIKQLCSKLDVKLSRVSNEREFKLPELMAIDGKFIDDRLILKLEHEFRSIISELVEISKVINPLFPYGNLSKIYDAISIDSWLQSKGVSVEGRNFFTDLDSKNHSILALLSLIAGSGGNNLFFESESHVIVGGSSALISKLSLGIAESVTMNSYVDSIEFKSKWCEVNVANKYSGKRFSKKSRVVVLAIPPACIPNVNISNFRINRKEFPMMSRNKTISVTLNDRAPLKDLYIVTNNSNRIIYTQRGKFENEQQIKIHECPHLSSNKKFGVINSTLNLCNIPKEAVKNVYKINWENSKWSYGSYPFYDLGKLRSHSEMFKLKPSRLFFVGDFLLPGVAGYMEGATKSAELISSEIESFLKK